jgi:hypothetical protein
VCKNAFSQRHQRTACSNKGKTRNADTGMTLVLKLSLLLTVKFIFFLVSVWNSISNEWSYNSVGGHIHNFNQSKVFTKLHKDICVRNLAELPRALEHSVQQ